MTESYVELKAKTLICTLTPYLGDSSPEKLYRPIRFFNFNRYLADK